MKNKFFSCAVVFLLLCVVLSAGIFGYSRRIKRVDFSESFSPGLVPQEIECQIPQEEIDSVFGQKRKVYKIIRPRAGAQAKKLLKALDMEEYTTEKNGDVLPGISYTAAEKELCVHKDSTFLFRRRGRTSWEPMLVSPEAMAEDMLAYLKNLQIVPEDFYVSRTERRREGGVTTGVFMQFSREIDGFPVALGSRVWVEQDAQGLRELDAICFDYKEDGVLPTISLEEVCALIKTPQADIYYKEEMVSAPEKVVLQSAHLLYYDISHLGGNYIFPCYKVKGEVYGETCSGKKVTEFQATVMAIPCSMTRG